MQARRTPRNRGRLVALGGLAALVLTLLAGCGRDTHLQAQESAALAHTCQSLYERDHGVSAPPLPPRFLRDWLGEPPHGFRGPSTRDAVHQACNLLPGPRHSRLDTGGRAPVTSTTVAAP